MNNLKKHVQHNINKHQESHSAWREKAADAESEAAKLMCLAFAEKDLIQMEEWQRIFNRLKE